jgi:large subunit ribosomal protein L9
MGEVVDVKDGYAMNYLIPQKLAYAALKGNMKALEEEKKKLEKKLESEIAEAKAVAEKLSGVSVSIPKQVGEEDKIFGTVTAQDVADGLKEKGFEADKRKIELSEPIKALGIYSASVKLHPEVDAKVKVWVVRE